jgi:hypothetical protein
MGCERGQATIEWTGLVLLVSLAFAALLALGPRIDGRSFGAWLTHEIVCAVRGGCGPGDDELLAAYGRDDAELVRRYAPNIAYEPETLTLPIDWRECRSHRCSDAAAAGGVDVARSRSGAPATAFTHLARRDGSTYLQYWFYYPDSSTLHAGGKLNYEKLGYHLDDWEAYEVRLSGDGTVHARATAHGSWRNAKGAPDGVRWLVDRAPAYVRSKYPCELRTCGEWGRWTGWTRVTRGSHAGHIPDGPGDERSTSGSRLTLVPLETVDRSSYEPLGQIKPPWEKGVYDDPASEGS